MIEETDLLVVGGGAKAAALAAKIHVINSLGLGPIALTIIEKTEWAASWSGRNGMTSGEEPLAIPPIKDVGFPYESGKLFGEAGEAIDAGLLPFTWQRYMMSRGKYARWVNADSPAVQHRDYGRYLAWVLSHATEGVRLIRGRVTEVSLQDSGRWQVEVAETEEASRHSSGAIVLTGPGIHRDFSHDPEIGERLFHCDSKRGEFSRIAAGQSSEVAIVGGGESALSCLVFLRAFRPDARITVFTPTLPLSRGESFLENRIFSNPDSVSWSSLDLQTRRDFVKHCDRGVFDPQTLASIAGDQGCEWVTGRVIHVGTEDGGDGVSVEYDAPAEGVVEARFDYCVNCTGFDLLAQLRDLFPEEVRAEVERQAGPLWEGPPQVEVPIGRTLELEGMRPRLFIPGLAGLRQGPGFANLGSLGLLSNRVLMPFLLDEERLSEHSERPSATAVANDR
ncbi:MAG TPA: SidA/IucD/PvdA family monooxygenase [Solirubrobacterales bacterium]